MYIKKLLYYCFFYIAVLLFQGATGQLFAKHTEPPPFQRLLSPDSLLTPVYSIPVRSTCFSIDQLQNYYIADDAGSIFKYSHVGTFQFSYNNKRLGEVGKIDASNPLSVLVYYPAFETIILLDRTLSPIRELNLFDFDVLEPKGVAVSNDNNIWVFDQVTAQLKKLDPYGTTLFESRNLNQITQKNIVPEYLLENNNLLYLSDTENGLFVFDNFGQLKEEVPIRGVGKFQIEGSQIIYFKNKQLVIYNMESFFETSIDLPSIPGSILEIDFQKKRIFIRQPEVVAVYQIKLEKD